MSVSILTLPILNSSPLAEHGLMRWKWTKWKRAIAECTLEWWARQPTIAIVHCAGFFLFSRQMRLVYLSLALPNMNFICWSSVTCESLLTGCLLPWCIRFYFLGFHVSIFGCEILCVHHAVKMSAVVNTSVAVYLVCEWFMDQYKTWVTSTI